MKGYWWRAILGMFVMGASCAGVLFFLWAVTELFS